MLDGIKRRRCITQTDVCAFTTVLIILCVTASCFNHSMDNSDKIVFFTSFFIIVLVTEAKPLSVSEVKNEADLT